MSTTSKTEESAAEKVADHAEVMPNAVRLFREKCDVALSRIKTLEEFRASDTMVDFVVSTGRALFDTPLDQHPIDSMLRTGGKLTGAYAYLGQKSAWARAERDVYEQKAKEVEREIVLSHVQDKAYKVTQAKAVASEMMSEMMELVLLKEAEKNQWENITEATQMMVMFLQSSIRVREGERYQSSRMHDQS